MFGVKVQPRPAAEAEPLEERLIALGRRYDAAPVFPAESLRLLEAGGFHRRFAPVAAGGCRFPDVRARLAAMFDDLRFVGRCDLSVGRLYEGHVNALLLFERHADPDQLDWLATALDLRAWFGVWATEPPPGVRIIEDKRPSLHGIKSFASGAGGLSYALVTVAPPHGDMRLVIVPAYDGARADG